MLPTKDIDMIKNKLKDLERLSKYRGGILVIFSLVMAAIFVPITAMNPEFYLIVFLIIIVTSFMIGLRWINNEKKKERARKLRRRQNQNLISTALANFIEKGRYDDE